MNALRTRVPRRPVHGVLLLDKPLGLSSHNALQKVKWLLRAEKAGNTGTLDQSATGERDARGYRCGDAPVYRAHLATAADAQCAEER